MKYIVICCAVLACILSPAIGQQITQAVPPHRTCGAVEMLQEALNNNPGLAASMAAIEAHTQQHQFAGTHHGGPTVIKIPVVVHVLYNNATQNISTAQVQSQIDVLNADFRRTNTDAGNTLAQFVGVAADTEIEFCLASVDPTGAATTGITRTSTAVAEFTYPGSGMKSTAAGGIDAWDTTQYMNLWCCRLAPHTVTGNTILGFAQFPGGAASTDGIVVDYRFYGTGGTATAPYHLGRTGTHEVGHWLNLKHIWGDGPCGVDDGVADTPESDDHNGGCPLGHTSCGTLDMVQNYMDYTHDSCMNLFTAGQTARMRALFAPGGARAGLLTSVGCATTPEWQINQPVSSINFDGTIGHAFNAAVTTKCMGDTGTFTLSSAGSTASDLFNIGFMVRAGYPSSAAQSIETAGGQIFHVDLGHPSIHFWNLGTVPTVIPYIGDQSIPYNAAAAVQYSAQMCVMNPASVDGYTLSQCAQLDINPSVSMTPLTLDDDNFVLVTPSSPVTFMGTTTAAVYVNSNGSVSLNAGDSSFSPTVSSFLSGAPKIAGNWSDLSPNNGGSITWDDSCGDTVISFSNVPEFGQLARTASFDVIFATNGNTSISNRLISPGWATTTVTGFTPGGGATGTAVTFSALIGGTTSYGVGDAIYEYANNATTSTFSSATLRAFGFLTVH